MPSSCEFLHLARRNAEAAEIEAWLAPFHPDDRALAQAALDEAMARGGRLIGPTDALRELMWDPRRMLLAFAADMEALLRSIAGRRSVVWLLDLPGEGQGGLSRVDLNALFQPWLFVDRILEVEPATGTRRVMALTRTRQETVAVCLHLPDGPPNGTAIDAGLQAVERSGLESTVLLLTPGQANAFISFTRRLPFIGKRDMIVAPRDMAGALNRIQLMADAERLHLGLRLPADEIDPWIRNPEHAVTLLAHIAGRKDACRFLCCEPPAPVWKHPAMTEAMVRAGIAVDCSYRADAPRRLSENFIVLHGSYLRSGGYRPFAFDRRIPAPLMEGPGPVGLVRHRAERARSEADWAAIWERRRDARLELLVAALDYKRREKFNLTLDQPVARNNQSQWYHMFGIFNWPPPDPVERATLFDLGALDTPEALSNKLIGLLNFMEQQGEGVRVADAPRALTAAAEAEAAARCHADVAAILDAQREAHRYLGVNPSADPSAPLTPTIEDFVSFLPEALGRTVEVGAGHGQLARALGPRSTFYACVDLDHTSFRNLDPARNELGTVADLHSLPFADGSLDSIVANNILEHFYDPIGGLTEIRRVLAPGGRLYGLIPLDALNADYRLPAHLWKADYTNVLTALSLAGFDAERVEFLDANLLGWFESYPSCDGLHIKFWAKAI